MDKFDLLLADRVRDIAHDFRHIAMVDYIVGIESSFTCDPVRRLEIIEHWRLDHPIDEYVLPAISELYRISAIINTHPLARLPRFEPAANNT